MRPERQRTAARAIRVAAGAGVLLVVTAMAVDYAFAIGRDRKDAARIAALQAEAHSDAAYAARVAAAHDEVTRARRARKTRTDALAWVLLAASALLIGSSKWLTALERRRTVPVIPLASLRHEVRRAAARAQPQIRSTGAPGVDLAVVDRIIASAGTTREAAIPILQAIQAHFRYLPDEALAHVCESTEVTAAQIAGTSSFYARFRRSPVGEHIVRVCHGTACHVAGARHITDELRRHLDIAEGADTDRDRLFTIDEVACLGCCSLAPVLMVDEHTAGRLTPSTACAALEHVAEVQRA